MHLPTIISLFAAIAMATAGPRIPAAGGDNKTPAPTGGDNKAANVKEQAGTKQIDEKRGKKACKICRRWRKQKGMQAVPELEKMGEAKDDNKEENSAEDKKEVKAEDKKDAKTEVKKEDTTKSTAETKPKEDDKKPKV